MNLERAIAMQNDIDSKVSFFAPTQEKMLHYKRQDALVAAFDAELNATSTEALVPLINGSVKRPELMDRLVAVFIERRKASPVAAPTGLYYSMDRGLLAYDDDEGTLKPHAFVGQTYDFMPEALAHFVKWPYDAWNAMRVDMYLASVLRPKLDTLERQQGWAEDFVPESGYLVRVPLMVNMDHLEIVPEVANGDSVVREAVERNPKVSAVKLRSGEWIFPLA